MGPVSKANGCACAIHPVTRGFSLAQPRRHVQVPRARAAAQPLHRAAGREIDVPGRDVHRHRARGLVQVGDHVGPHLVRALHDRRHVLHESALEDHVREGHQQRRLVDGGEVALEGDGDAVVASHHLHARAEIPVRLVDVHDGGEVQVLVDDLVARPAEVEAGQDHGLAHRDVLVHHHRAGRGADDAPDPVAHRDRHVPPSLGPRPHAPLRPEVGVGRELRGRRRAASPPGNG